LKITLSISVSEGDRDGWRDGIAEVSFEEPAIECGMFNTIFVVLIRDLRMLYFIRWFLSSISGSINMLFGS
jgi:hypothetical protein